MSHTDKISVGSGTCATVSGRNSIGSYFESPSAVSATVPFALGSAPPGAYCTLIELLTRELESPVESFLQSMSGLDESMEARVQLG
jgi:hypothetical protein